MLRSFFLQKMKQVQQSKPPKKKKKQLQIFRDAQQNLTV